MVGLTAALTALAGTAVLAGTALADPPVTRDSAADEARRELSKGIYHTDDPSLPQRAWNWVVHWLDRALASVGRHAPGGPPGAVLLLAALALLVWYVLWRAGPLHRGSRRAPLLSTMDGTLTARQHRERAEQLAMAGRHADAIREWMRASARDLEERGVLDPRPGRTADEVAAEGAAQVPEVAAALATAARTFDEVWYGGRPATAELAAALRGADDTVRRASLAVAR